MTHYPFAENEVVVWMIWQDIKHAMWGVPVLFFASHRLLHHFRNGSAWGVKRSLGIGVTSIGWIAHFVMFWVIPKPIAIDLNALHEQMTDAELSGRGKIGYFDCTLTLVGGRTLAWSARKLCAVDRNGERTLWVEGNADEFETIAASLATASDVLAFPPPTVATIAARAERSTDNRVPLWSDRSRSQPATVLVFREPNGLVTPCLLVRY